MTLFSSSAKKSKREKKWEKEWYSKSETGVCSSPLSSEQESDFTFSSYPRKACKRIPSNRTLVSRTESTCGHVAAYAGSRRICVLPLCLFILPSAVPASPRGFSFAFIFRIVITVPSQLSLNSKQFTQKYL